MVGEVLTLMESEGPGVLIDATLGGGGHAAAILQARSDLRVLGVDRDPAARVAALSRLAPYGDRVRVVAGTFADVSALVAAERDFIGSDPIVAILYDLGVSSRQLDDPERGFSYRFDAPLDMRMDPTRGATAAEVLAGLSRAELIELLRDNGEARFAGAIADRVIAERPVTTFELVRAVEAAVPPAARRRGNAASRVFQALRIAVNHEIDQLGDGLEAGWDALSVGGVMIVISYHSGEDRMVKAFFHDAATGGCHCPPEIGCVCGAVPTARVPRASARLASADEVAENPRAHSARLRSAWKVAA